MTPTNVSLVKEAVLAIVQGPVDWPTIDGVDFLRYPDPKSASEPSADFNDGVEMEPPRKMRKIAKRKDKAH